MGEGGVRGTLRVHYPQDVPVDSGDNHCYACQVIDGRGSIGMHHCRTCHRTWPWSHTRKAHCSECHRHFSGTSTYQLHIVDGQCIDPALAGLTQNATGEWRGQRRARS